MADAAALQACPVDLGARLEAHAAGPELALAELILLDGAAGAPAMAFAHLAERAGATDYLRADDAMGDLRLRLMAVSRRVLTRHRERHRGDDALSPGADVDPVTGLPTVTLLKRRLAGDPSLQAAEDDSHTAVILLDLERFSRVGAAYGGAGSDRILAEVATRLKGAVQSLALGGLLTRWSKAHHQLPFLARTGHDRFVLVLPGLSQIGYAESAARRLLGVIDAPVMVEGRPLYLSARVGISLSPEDGRSVDALLAGAQSALDHAKSAKPGKSSPICYYSATGAASAAERLKIENRLRDAMEAGELEVKFQPQVGMLDKRVRGVEALVRWTSPEFGEVAPELLVAAAQEAGLLADLGQYMLKESMRRLLILEARGLRPLKLSVNISADMLQNSYLVDFLGDELARQGFPPDRLMLELTESLVVDDPDHAVEVIGRLKALKVRLALDDFGTGYSSLSYLKSLPFDCLKIDRSFIAGRDLSDEDQGVLRAIIALAKTLNMTLIAEGVETLEQRDWLRREGCDLYQGYLCAPPLAGEELLEVFGGAG